MIEIEWCVCWAACRIRQCSSWTEIQSTFSESWTSWGMDGACCQPHANIVWSCWWKQSFSRCAKFLLSSVCPLAPAVLRFLIFSSSNHLVVQYLVLRGAWRGASAFCIYDLSHEGTQVKINLCIWEVGTSLHCHPAHHFTAGTRSRVLFTSLPSAHHWNTTVSRRVLLRVCISASVFKFKLNICWKLSCSKYFFRL